MTNSNEWPKQRGAISGGVLTVGAVALVITGVVATGLFSGGGVNSADGLRNPSVGGAKVERSVDTGAEKPAKQERAKVEIDEAKFLNSAESAYRTEILKAMWQSWDGKTLFAPYEAYPDKYMEEYDGTAEVMIKYYAKLNLPQPERYQLQLFLDLLNAELGINVYDVSLVRLSLDQRKTEKTDLSRGFVEIYGNTKKVDIEVLRLLDKYYFGK